MATSSNPRKFSEKIALHNQKQAEETAAFEEVMKDLSLTRAARLQLQKPQFLQLGPGRGQYYGGSLPNVSQLGSGAADLAFQTPFPPSGLDTSRTSRHHGLVERVCRERGRLGSPHRRPLSVDKHGRQADSCPYSTVYLSPPADSSWRRTNSDSALHQSTMAPSPPEPFSTSPQDAHQKRVLLLTVPGIEDAASETDKSMAKPTWDGKKAGSRPKSCEVPGINIFPSAEPEGVSSPSSSSLLPAAPGTGGSLPDLSTLHFPSPLPTPLDPEEPGFPALGSAGSTGALPHLTLGGPTPGVSTPGTSPQHHVSGVSTQPSPTSPSLSPLSPITQAAAMDALALEQQLPFAFFSPGSQPPPQPPPPPPAAQPPPRPVGLPPGPLPRGPPPPLLVTEPSRPPPAPDAGPPPMVIEAPALQQYRSSTGSPANQSPTSPVSSHGFSPASSPQHSSSLAAVFGDAYYEQQMAARQANALSHQLEQFNMVEGTLYSPASALNFPQAAVGSLPDALGYAGPGIPNIILTVTGESPPSLTKELADVGDVGFEADHHFPLDELKIDPLTLDGLHMLSDPDMVLADPATEDAFRMDRL